MAKRELWPWVKAVTFLLLYAVLAVTALSFTEQVGRRGLIELRQLYSLSRLPTRPLGETWTTPALVRARLVTTHPRLSPSGRDSALWYAWVENVRRSGRNSYTDVVCSLDATTGLALREAAHTVPLDLLESEGKGTILKGTWLESLPLDEVALDLGAIYHTRDIPQPMLEYCGRRLPVGGSLTYYEASLPSGSAVTVLGCASPESVHRCSPKSSPPGVLTMRQLRYVLHAYANHTLDRLRVLAVFVGVALCLLAAALFNLRRTGAS